MKKVIGYILLIVVMLGINVNAANYEVKELIPRDVITTVKTKSFIYKEILLSENEIIVKAVRNIHDGNLPMSIKVGLFDEDKKNIGTINYCNKEEEITYKEERALVLTIDSDYLMEEKTYKDVKYMAVLGDNKSCATLGHDDYFGLTVEKIDVVKNDELGQDTRLLIKILSVIGAVLFSLFLYKFMFTRSYDNFDGDDVRIGYKKYNKKLKEEREEELRTNPPKPKEIVKTKTDEVIKQEEEAKNKKADDTDLHNMYK